jgi:hypothetical protein
MKLSYCDTSKNSPFLKKNFKICIETSIITNAQLKNLNLIALNIKTFYELCLLKTSEYSEEFKHAITLFSQ